MILLPKDYRMDLNQQAAAAAITLSSTGAVVSTGLLDADVLHQFMVFFAGASGAVTSLTYVKSTMSFGRKFVMAIGSSTLAYHSYEPISDWITPLQGYDSFTGFIIGFLAFNLLGGIWAMSSKFSNSPFAVVDWFRGKGGTPKE